AARALRLVGDGAAHVLGAEHHAERVVAGSAALLAEGLAVVVVEARQCGLPRHHADEAGKTLRRLGRLHQAARDRGQERGHGFLRLLRREAELARKAVDRLAVLGVRKHIIKAGHGCSCAYLPRRDLRPGQQGPQCKRAAMRREALLGTRPFDTSGHTHRAVVWEGLMQIATERSTLAESLWPAQAAPAWLRNMLLAVGGSLLLTLSAKINVPFYPVPMTMQTFAVLLIGAAFGWRLGTATVLLYLAQGAAGLPVFAGTPEKGIGLLYLMGPTGGYLVGFAVAAAVVGWLAERGW